MLPGPLALGPLVLPVSLVWGGVVCSTSFPVFWIQELLIFQSVQTFHLLLGRTGDLQAYLLNQPEAVF